MTRVFADLHLRVNPKDQQATQRLITKAARFGYSQISIPFTSKLNEEELAKLKAACSEAGLDFVSRADFIPRTENDLTHFLRKFRRKFEVICITCDNKEVARQAAKDRRVDLLNFPSLDYHKRFFDRAEAELASSSLAALEVDVKPLLILEGRPALGCYEFAPRSRHRTGISCARGGFKRSCRGAAYADAKGPGEFSLLVWAR